MSGNRGKGRPRGAKNKVTAAVKDMVVAALDELGGVKYLKQQAADNPTAFMALVGRVIPTQVTGDRENPVRHVHTIELVSKDGV